MRHLRNVEKKYFERIDPKFKSCPSGFVGDSGSSFANIAAHCTLHTPCDKQHGTGKQEKYRAQNATELTRRGRWIQKGRSKDRVRFPIGKVVDHKVLEGGQSDARQANDLFSVVDGEHRVECFHGNDHRWPAVGLVSGDGSTRQPGVGSLDQDGATGVDGFLNDFLDLPKLGGTDDRQGASLAQPCPLQIGGRFGG